MHLPRLTLLNRGDNEAGAAEDDLSSGPAVDRQLELPFPYVICARQLHALRALDGLGLPYIEERRGFVELTLQM